MRYVFVNSNKVAAAVLQKCVDAVIPSLPASVAVTVAHGPLDHFLHSYLSPGTSAIVSPANSLSYMGGGFDRAVLDVLTGANYHYKLLESAIQDMAWRRHNGYIVPATVHRVDLAQAFSRASIEYGSSVAGDKRITTLVQVPTMAVPEQTSPQTVFDSMWNVLVETQGMSVDTVILPAFGAGYGGIGIELASHLMATAIGLFYVELPPLARSAGVLLFTGKDYRKFELPSDLADVEQHLSEKGRLVAGKTQWALWDELMSFLKPPLSLATLLSD